MPNTFDGILGEFPFIGVDRFDTSASVFLLTHCHTDHIIGLHKKSLTGLIYCSQATKDLLIIEGDCKWANLVNVLEYNVPTRLEIPQYVKNVYGEVYVTMISSYHCVGSCMFLVENSNGSILVTGDIRAEKWWRDSLRNIPTLHPYIGGLKTLDNIYFDATFGYRGEPYIEMPANNAGIHIAICLLKEYPKNDPEICYVFQDTVLGFEQAWAFILSFFRASLCIPDEKLRRSIKLAIKHDIINGPALAKALKRGKSSNGIFYAGKQANDLVQVHIKQCINFNVMDFTGVCCPILLNTMPNKERERMELVQETKLGNKVYSVRDRLWILPKNGHELLPVDVKLVFSRHSSYTETRDLISMFRPKQVYPCWHSKIAWLNGFSMLRLFGSSCSSDIFQFDSMMRSQYGEPVKNISVSTINRWDVDSCRQEETFVKSIMEDNRKLIGQGASGNNIALINIRRVAQFPVFRQHSIKEDNQGLSRKRSKNFQLQKIVEGRKEALYSKFIEAQQQLYYKRHNLSHYEGEYHGRKYQQKLNSALGGSSDCDTNSSSSSLDLAEIATNRTSGSQVSVIAESQCTSNQCGVQLSFIKSSFESFEETVCGHKSHLSQSIYFHAETHVNPAHIEIKSRLLRANPQIWSTSNRPIFN